MKARVANQSVLGGIASSHILSSTPSNREMRCATQAESITIQRHRNVSGW
jgi:hypothetical protein